MATYYISPGGNDTTGDGSSGSPWKTPQYAHDTMSAGDTCILKNGTYSGAAYKLTISKNNVTFRAENEHGAVIDGGWGWAQVNAGSWLNIGKSRPNWWTIGKVGTTPSGVTVQDIVFQNIPATGLQVLKCANVTIDNNVFYCCYLQGINAAPDGTTSSSDTNFITGITMTDNQCYYCSLSWWDPTFTTDGPDPAQGSIRAGKIRTGAGNPALIQGNIVAYGFGEGMDIGKFNEGTTNYPVVVEGNTVHDCNHALLYFSLHSEYIVARGNTVYNVNNAVVDGKRLYSSGLTSRDEQFDMANKPGSNGAYNSNHNQLYNNLSVNCITNAITEGNQQYIYVGFNTYVAGPNTERTFVLVKPNAGTHTNCLFENNIVHTKYTTQAPIATGSGWTFRSNVFTRSVDSKFLANGGEVGDANSNVKLVNPGIDLRVTGLTKAATFAAFNPSDNFNASNYRPVSTDTKIINKAGAETALGGVTPPSYPFDYDFDGTSSTRSTPDRGAFEYGSGTVPPPTNSANAAFTISDSTITAGTSVTFTDTSSSTPGGTITGWFWQFGDGATSTVQSPSHTYTTAGVYTVRLTATNSDGDSDVATGTVTVSQPPSEVSGNVDVVQAAMNTSTGAQTIALSLSGTAPQALLFLVTNATANDTLTAGAQVSVGLWAQDGGGRCDVFYSEDNVADSDTYRGYFEPEVIVLLDGTGAVIARAEVASVAADSVTINITDAPPSAYLMQIMAWGGATMRAKRVSLGAGNAGSQETLQTTFNQEVHIVASSFAAIEDVVEANADFSFGFSAVEFWLNFGGTNSWIYNQNAFNWAHFDALAAGAPEAKLNSNEVAATRTGYATGAESTPARASVRVMPGASPLPETALRNTVWEVLRNNINRTINVLAIGTGGEAGAQAQVIGMTTPTATGAQTYYATNLGQNAGAMLALVSQATAAETLSGNVAGSGGIYLSDGTHDFTVAWADEKGAATINSNCYVSTSMTSLTHAGAELDEATVAIGEYDGTPGIQATFGTVSGLARFWPALVFSIGTTPTDPTAEFTADVTNIQPGDTVTFTDLSTGNGDTIVSWFWDFGDGGYSTDQNPTHDYGAVGRYTVSLTVETATAENTETKADYISVAQTDTGKIFISGPHMARSITHLTKNFTGIYMGQAGQGTHTHEVDLDAVPLNQIGASGYPAPVEGKYLFGVSASAMWVIRPDGAVATIPLEWGSPLPPTGGAGSYSLTLTVAASADDAQEGSGTMTLTDLSIGMTAGTRNGGFRFRNVTIPQGATITSAVLQFYVVTNDDPVIDIYGEDTANSVAFTTDASDITNRTKTTAVVNWDEDNIGTGAYKDTPDVSTIVQEIVNRTDWQSGNAMTFILDGLGSPAVTSCNIRAYDYADGAYAAKLVVNYTV